MGPVVLTWAPKSRRHLCFEDFGFKVHKLCWTVWNLDQINQDIGKITGKILSI